MALWSHDASHRLGVPYPRGFPGAANRAWLRANAREFFANGGVEFTIFRFGSVESEFGSAAL